MKDKEPDTTALALDRTVLANERTFQAWIRTGLSALAAGLGVAKFLQDAMPLWMLLTIAVVLIVLSIAAFLQASWRYTHLHLRIADLDVDATPLWLVKMISFMLAGCSVLALFGIFLAAFW